MGNREKWAQALEGKTHYEAWKLIWGKNKLTSEQKKALYKFWDDLQKKKTERVFKEALNPDWWGK